MTPIDRPDGTRSDDVEYSLARAEHKAVAVLLELEQRWPLRRGDKSLVAEFIGLQWVRGPQWYEWHCRFGREQFDHMMRR